MVDSVNLRDVQESDLGIFFEQQRDPLSNRMAAMQARDRETFLSHWQKIMQDETIVLKTILVNEQVAGNLVSFIRSGQREVGYWLGRDFWGRGIATKALSAFLLDFKERPLFAYVAKHNAASFRVLEKCGFKLQGEEKNFAVLDGQAIEGFILKLVS